MNENAVVDLPEESDGEITLMKIEEQGKSETEKYVLRVFKYEDGPPKVEKRKYFLDQGVWKKSKAVSLMMKDLRKISSRYKEIIDCMAKNYQRPDFVRKGDAESVA